MLAGRTGKALHKWERAHAHPEGFLRAVFGFILTCFTAAEAKRFEHQREICKGREGNFQWWWGAAFFLVTWEKLAFRNTLSTSLCFTLSQENSEYSLNFTWQLMLAHTTFWGVNSCSSCWQLIQPGWPIALTFVPSYSFLMVKKKRDLCMHGYPWLAWTGRILWRVTY